MARMGRPTAYTPEYHDDKVFKLALLGMTDKEIADVFEVSEQTFNTWKQKHPDFIESLKKGKEDADGDIAKSLYHRAKGYSHPEDKIFCNNGEVIVEPTIKHYPPDTAAAMIWLKNRQPAKWRDKQEVVTSNTEVDIDSLKAEIRELVKENGFHENNAE